MQKVVVVTDGVVLGMLGGLGRGCDGMDCFIKLWKWRRCAQLQVMEAFICESVV